MPKKISQNEKVYYEICDEKNKKYKCCIIIDGKGECGEVVSAKNPFGFVSHIRSTHTEIYRNEINPDVVDTKTIAVKKLKLIQDCTEYVTVNGRSFNQLRDSAVQSWIKEKVDELKNNKCGIDLNDRFTEIKKYISTASDKIKEKIKMEVENRFVSVMIDAGSKNSISILSICIQYVIDGEIVIRNIGMLQMVHRHTANYIKEMLMNQLAIFGIDKLQILSITRDNASNMRATVKLFDDDISAIQQNDEDENTVNEEVTSHEIIQNHQFDATQNSFTINRIQDIIQQYNIDDDDVDEDEELGAILNDESALMEATRSIEIDLATLTVNVSSVPCSAHTLQLAVNEALNLPEVIVIIALCRTVGKLLRRQTYIYELQEADIVMKTIRMDCKVRWNSIYRMVRFIFTFLSLFFFLNEISFYLLS